ncbi:hypothetical protein C8F01DRAFT_1156966 [Mycena amicta]|nr:hypothetical protein C8F01DRAFT_1156966 [Mycena amicta]
MRRPTRSLPLERTPMALDTLSQPALEALLAFHLDAAGQIQERIRAAFFVSMKAESEAVAAAGNEQRNQVSLELHPQASPNAYLQSPFRLRSVSYPTSSPKGLSLRIPRPRSSPPSLRPPSSPVFGGLWRYDTGPTSPSPSPSLGTKRRHAELEDSDGVDSEVIELQLGNQSAVDDRPYVRVRGSRCSIPLVPGWPRGVMRTPTPKRRKVPVWDKENCKEY